MLLSSTHLQPGVSQTSSAAQATPALTTAVTTAAYHSERSEDKFDWGSHNYSGLNGATWMAVPSLCGQVGRHFGPVGQLVSIAAGAASNVGFGLAIAAIADGHADPAFLGKAGLAGAAAALNSCQFGIGGTAVNLAVGYGYGFTCA